VSLHGELAADELRSAVLDGGTGSLQAPTLGALSAVSRVAARAVVLHGHRDPLSVF